MQADMLQDIIAKTPIVVIASKLTDTRTLERRLNLAGVDFRIVMLGMASAEHRAAFEALRESSGHKQLPMVFVDGHCIGGEPELLAHPRLNPGPRIAWHLGLAGLLPMIAGALGSHLQIGLIGPHIFDATLAYAVLILAFMAGTQWGGAVLAHGRRNHWRYLVSVIPPLAVWPAWLMGPEATLVVLIAGFGWLLATDIGWGAGKTWPWWYIRLRAVLTAGVMISLLILLEAVPGP